MTEDNQLPETSDTPSCREDLAKNMTERGQYLAGTILLVTDAVGTFDPPADPPRIVCLAANPDGQVNGFITRLTLGV